nr:hypothetical protein CFP56_09649 [Quercus suber]
MPSELVSYFVNTVAFVVKRRLNGLSLICQQCRRKRRGNTYQREGSSLGCCLSWNMSLGRVIIIEALSHEVQTMDMMLDCSAVFKMINDEGAKDVEALTMPNELLRIPSFLHERCQLPSSH